MRQLVANDGKKIFTKRGDIKDKDKVIISNVDIHIKGNTEKKRKEGGWFKEKINITPDLHVIVKKYDENNKILSLLLSLNAYQFRPQNLNYVLENNHEKYIEKEDTGFTFLCDPDIKLPVMEKARMSAFHVFVPHKNSQKKTPEIIKKILISPSNDDPTNKQIQRIEEFMNNLIIYYLTYFPINMIPEHLKNNTKNIDKLIDGTLAREIKTLPKNRENQENKFKILEEFTCYEINNERGIEFILRSLCSIKLMKYIYEDYSKELINKYLLEENDLLDDNKLLRYFSGLIFGIIYGNDKQKVNDEWAGLELNFKNTNFKKMNEHILTKLDNSEITKIDVAAMSQPISEEISEEKLLINYNLYDILDIISNKYLNYIPNKYIKQENNNEYNFFPPELKTDEETNKSPQQKTKEYILFIFYTLICAFFNFYNQNEDDNSSRDFIKLIIKEWCEKVIFVELKVNKKLQDTFNDNQKLILCLIDMRFLMEFICIPYSSNTALEHINKVLELYKKGENILN